MLHEPCKTPLMHPRERIGHCSMASAAPAGHSAPMPIPSKVRKINRNIKVGENPAMKLQIEYQKIEIISGSLRPTRSASQPEATAPTSRIHRVSVKTMATSVVGTPNSSAIGLMISRKTVKSKASRVHPSQAAHQAYHCPLVGSFHQGMLFTVSTAAIRYLPFRSALCLEPCRQNKAGCRKCRGCFSTARQVPRRSSSGARFQATVRSATRTFPLVSGHNSTATRKMANPTTVVTRIGPERVIWWVVAYQSRSGEINPPQIAPWCEQKATAVARTSVGNRSER